VVKGDIVAIPVSKWENGMERGVWKQETKSLKTLLNK